MPEPIQLLRVSGSHREAGRSIGRATAGYILERVGPWFDRNLPEGREREEQLAIAADYRAATAEALPQVVEECDGIAEGAGVDPLALFATGIEEIWYEPRGRCSDLVAGPAATADGHLLIGHNNDLSPSNEEHIVAIERNIDGEPTVLTLGVGPWPSAGWSNVGISFTGNELSPNDERVGIPRMLQFRAMLGQSSFEAVLATALHTERASSYNNLLAARDGRVVNVEGSATDAELSGLDEAGLLAHTNHYACDRMLGYEGDPEYAYSSAVRLERASDLLAEARGTVTMDSMRSMLADHNSTPPLCRHVLDGDDDASKTVFWCVCDATDMVVAYGRGNPCDSTPQTYRF